MKKWLTGKKTYIVAGLTLAMGVAQAFGVALPELVYPVLAALGLGSLRSGVNRIAETFDRK